MLTIVYRQDDGFSMVNGRRLSRDMFDFAALSSDERPSGIYQSAVIANGSTLTEIDTGTVYSYDEQHSCWCVQSGAAGAARKSASGSSRTAPMHTTPVTAAIIRECSTRARSTATYGAQRTILQDGAL